MLGGYHIFRIPIEYGFIKKFIKGFSFHFFSPKIYMPGNGIHIFKKKIKLVIAMLVLEIFENSRFSFVSSHKLHITY